MGSEHPFSHKNLKFQWTIYRPGTAESGKGEAKPFLGCGMGEAITGMGSRLPDALCFQFLFLKPKLTITRLKNTTMTMKAFFTCGMGEKFWHGTEAPKWWQICLIFIYLNSSSPSTMNSRSEGHFFIFYFFGTVPTAWDAWWTKCGSNQSKRIKGP